MTPVTRGLAAISPNATRERDLLRAWLAAARATAGHVDDAWEALEDGRPDGPVEPELESRRLLGLSFCRRMSAQFEASAADSRRVLGLIRSEALWDRADALINLLYCEYMLGRLRRV